MGYPVREYRTTQGRNTPSGFQGSGLKPKSASILGFPADVSEKKGRRERMRERKGKGPQPYGRKPPKYGPRPNTRPNRPLKKSPRTRNPLSYGSRLANRQLALSGLQFGLKFRARLLRGVARWLLGALARNWADKMKWPHPHPLWTVNGIWGDPVFTGLTNAHNFNGSWYAHLKLPGRPNGGDAWDGPPFTWMEIDQLDRIATNRWDYHQVGKGLQNNGPDPRGMGWWNPFSANVPVSKNTGFNPWSPNHLPGITGLPGPVTGPEVELPISPTLDPSSQPIGQPQNTPLAIPRWLLPRRKPNPWNAPSEQTQWGPNRWHKTSQRDNPYHPWPDVLDPNGRGNPNRPRKPRGRPKGKDRTKDRDEPKDRDDPDPETPNPPPPTNQPTEFTYRPGRPRKEEVKFRRTEPPKKREKERKVKAPKWIMGLLNGVTEFSDLLRALYKALPKHRRRPNALIRDQWLAVYKYLDEINLNTAVRAVLRDQLEDFIYGGLGTIGGAGAHRRGEVIDAISRNARKIFDDLYDPFSQQNIDNRLGPNNGYSRWWADKLIQERYAEKTRARREFANDPVNAILDAIFGDFT